MTTTIRDELTRELVARGFSADLQSPHGTMGLVNDYATAIDLAELLDVMVVRREKIFWSASEVGHDIAKRNYEDVLVVIDAVKAVIGRLLGPELGDDELREIRARCDAARPGPWRSFVEGRDHTSGSSFIMTGENATRGDDIELTGATAADQDFIAHAREDVPRLLAEIERQRQAGVAATADSAQLPTGVGAVAGPDHRRPLPSRVHHVTKEEPMSVARVTEITAESRKSFEDAINQGISRANKTLKNVKGAWVQDQKVTVEDGKIAQYRVSLKVTFVLEE